VQYRQRAQVHGTVRAKRIQPLAGVPTLECVIADETGGRTFAMGTMPPVSFEPFLRQLNVLIGRQFLLTYATDNMKKGYYKVDVKSTNPEVKIEHPKGYYYRP